MAKFVRRVKKASVDADMLRKALLKYHKKENEFFFVSSECDGGSVKARFPEIDIVTNTTSNACQHCVALFSNTWFLLCLEILHSHWPPAMWLLFCLEVLHSDCFCCMWLLLCLVILHADWFWGGGSESRSLFFNSWSLSALCWEATKNVICYLMNNCYLSKSQGTRSSRFLNEVMVSVLLHFL